MSSVCPFSGRTGSGCPRDGKTEEGVVESATVAAKCPYGYDSQTFKLGPFSCVICQALLFESSKCSPCSHKFCKTCISPFRDCPICGADIERMEPDEELQALVDRFIDGHCRIKSRHLGGGGEGLEGVEKKVTYEDVSVERGSFLVQQAMRAFRAKNIGSAKSRLSLCAEDIREQLDRIGSNSDLCSQLGAVLGMLGDCCRATGDFKSAVSFYEESVELLDKLPTKEQEVISTLSVSLNKIGDLKYYMGDMQSTRKYYIQSLDLRRKSIRQQRDVSSQVVDLAVSLAKVADVDRALGDERTAISGFQEAIKCLEGLDPNKVEPGMEQKRQSVLSFLHKQIEEKATSTSAAT